MFYVYHIHRQGHTIAEGYIGISSDYKTRWIHHKQQLRKGTHSNPHLQNAWDKYDDITFSVLHTCKTAHEMFNYEVQYRPKPSIGWNCKSGGEINFTQSETTKDKIRSYNLGRTHSKESKEKMSAAKKGKTTHMKGKQHSNYTKDKIKAALQGTTLTSAHRLNISKGLVKHSEPRLWVHISGLWFFGTPLELTRTYLHMPLYNTAACKVYTGEANSHCGWVLG